MTLGGWTSIDAEIWSGDHPNQSLSYLSRDGQFAVITDYESHSSLLLLNASQEVLRARFASLLAPTPREGRLRALPPNEEVHGYGTFTFPYGPLDAGVPEAGRFDVRTYGERVLELVPIVGFKSRDIAQAVVGQKVADAALRVERIAGNLSASHVSAFLSAAESAQATAVRTEELWLRAVAQELQRMYNHIRVVAREAEAASQPVGASQTFACAEEVLRIQGWAFGHRWLFGALLPGGSRPRIDKGWVEQVASRTATVASEFARLWELFGQSRIYIDRIQTTATVGAADAMTWGAVGPTLRATGIRWDDRLFHAGPPYDDLLVNLPSYSEGDALARVAVRADEVQASALLIEQMAKRWPSKTAMTEPFPSVASGRGLARVEAPSGDLVYDVSVKDGRVTRVGWRSPTEANFPLFALGMRGAVFTDFHFAFESFGLVFAEIDG
jgi:Ni,Fe-hydrogenase III large subunit